MPHTPRSVAPAHLARLHQAVDQALQSVSLSRSAFDTRQTPPNHAAARQTTPPTPPMQNEPSCHNGTSAASPPTAHNTRQSAPFHANARRQSPVCKTNPAPPSRRTQRPLTPNQLRAAHLLVAGHSTTAIAATLSIDRHTLATWKAKPLFQLELRRILQSDPLITVTAGASNAAGRQDLPAIASGRRIGGDGASRGGDYASMRKVVRPLQ